MMNWLQPMWVMIPIVAMIVIMITSPLVLCIRKWIEERRRNNKRMARLPRGALGWPLIGETLDFISCAYSPRPESFMEKRCLLYGKVFKSHIFGAPAIVSTDAEISRCVLQSDAKTFIPSYPKSLTELMGKSSILLINGSLQKRVHGLVGSFFKSSQLKSQITRDMQDYVGRSMNDWRDGQLVLVQNEAKSIVFQILVRGLIGLQPGEKMQFLKQEFHEFIAGLMSLPIKFPGSRLYRSLKAKRRMANLIQKLIQEKRKNKNNVSDPRDAIDVLMEYQDDELTDDLISDNMIDLMIPAEDSVPVLITLAIKYLSEYPLALQQLEEENIELKKKKEATGELLEWSDYMSLSFTQHVITETLRMGNIISGIMRKAVRDVEIKGHFIPKGWCVFVYFRSTHLDEDIYEDSYKFNPWRWKERETCTNSFTPFGGGQRLCPGLDLARLEAAIFLHHLVTKFSWVHEPDQIINFPTVRMKKGMPIHVNRKNII